MILAPRRGKYAKKAGVKEASKEVLSGPEASFQNTSREVIRKLILSYNISVTQKGKWIFMDYYY